MTELQPARRSARVYDEMLARIVEGDWAVGDRLEPEARLAESFGVSRPVLREALARLRDAGLIVSRQGAGSTVAKRPDAAPATPMVAPLASIEDMQRCFEMRLTVEPDAAYFAALRRSEGDLAALDAISVSLASVNADTALGGDEDIAFHRAVAAASGNRFYAAIIDQISDHILQGILVNRTLKQGQGEARVGKVVGDHAAITEAIRAAEPDAAREAMRVHLAAARARVFEGPQ